MPFLKVIVLAIVQGLAELLPVSSSTHVVVAEKLMGLDPSAPAMTLLLVMLHTGTMFAVIAYFWSRWRATYFSSWAQFKRTVWLVGLATVLTGIIGYGLKHVIEKTILGGLPDAQIEDLFSHLEFIAPALAVAGILILVAGLRERRMQGGPEASTSAGAGPGDGTGSALLDTRAAGIIGAVQGLCLPFRGFSRSGATISTGMLLDVPKSVVEDFSFALAVVLTPPVVAREALRLIHAEQDGAAGTLGNAAFASLAGAVLAFLAGLVALRWLSRWLEGGRWYLFGVYCLVASMAVGGLYLAGF